MPVLDPTQLPDFPAPDGVDPAAVEASRKVVAHYLSTGDASLSIKELAALAGVSERTFYRLFPRKEDAIRPYVSAALQVVVGLLREEAAHRPLGEAVVASQGAVLDLARQLEVQHFLAVLASTERLRAAWLQVLIDAEQAFAGVVAEARGIDPASLEARLAGAAIVASGRLALDTTDRQPSAVLAECMALLNGGLIDRSAP